MEVAEFDAAIGAHRPEVLLECPGLDNALQSVKEPHDVITGTLSKSVCSWNSIRAMQMGISGY